LLAIGAIRSIPQYEFDMYTLISYEFEVSGISYLGYMQHPREMSRYWGVSDRVPVLYDPEDPSRSCIVYR
jgi:hypothetical protein